jgi:molybdopterin molybdotransferase
MAEAFTRRPGREEFIAARIEGEDASGLLRIVRAGHTGSARLLPLSRADGLLRLLAAAERIAVSNPARFHPFGTAFGL